MLNNYIHINLKQTRRHKKISTRNLQVYWPPYYNLLSHNFDCWLTPYTLYTQNRQKLMIFSIKISGRPDQVHNCTITNISMTSMGVRCSEGFNGGLPQTFMVEVRDSHTHDLRADRIETNDAKERKQNADCEKDATCGFHID